MNALLSHWLLATPIWLIGIFLFAGMLAFAWLGIRLRRRRDRAAGGKIDKDDAQEGLIVSAVMGLLALLVGFTFSLALDRYDARRMGVLEEANTIGTTYLRSQMVDAPYRQRLSSMLSQYADNRIAVAQLSPGPKLTELLARNDQLITDLWTETVAAWPSLKHYDFSSSYLDTMNAMIDMDATRRAARRAHVPAEVFLLLFIYQFVAAGVIGYVLVGERGRQTAAFLFALFGLSLLLVIDLDRPTDGGIIVSQQPMLDLQAMIRANPPPTFDRFNGTRTAVPPD
ncbi:hypothetical protein [Sphingomonas sp. KR3-1]|uniref:bestrophin-like domain n=1 Tax=Sphingomonas sp. KR3-1 TaxID=3156611 RepID=UPI0032B51B77